MLKKLLKFASVNLSLGITCYAASTALAKESGEKFSKRVFSATDPAITCDFYASSRLFQSSLQYKGSEFIKTIVRHLDVNEPKIKLPDLNFQKAFTHIKLDHAKFSLDVGLMLLDNGEITLPWISMTSKTTGYVRNSIQHQVLGLLFDTGSVDHRVMKVAQSTYANDPASDNLLKNTAAPFLPFSEILEGDEKISKIPMDERDGKTFGLIAARCLPGAGLFPENTVHDVSFTYADLKFVSP